MSEKNDQVNLDPEIWVNDNAQNRDREAMDDDDIDASIEEIFDDEDAYEAIVDNDFDRFMKVVTSGIDFDFDVATAQEIFLAARRDLEYDEDEDEDVTEALTLAQRRARGRVMKRMKSRLRVAKRMAQRRKASNDKLITRATRQARLALKKKMAAQRDYKTLTPTEKMMVDKRMERVNKQKIERLARKLLPAVRKKEMERMAKRASGNTDTSKKNEDVNPFEGYTATRILAEATIMELQEKGTCDLITMTQMKSFEKVVDGLFAKFNIDFKFTKHFAERMGDKRNDPCISLQDLADFIKKIYADVKNGKNSLSQHKDTEVVLKDLQQSLNIPVALEYDRKKDDLLVVMKTVMRKKNFSTPNKVVKY